MAVQQIILLSFMNFIGKISKKDKRVLELWHQWNYQMEANLYQGNQSTTLEGNSLC